VNRRATVLLVLWSAALLAAPTFADPYTLSVLTLVLWLAYTARRGTS